MTHKEKANEIYDKFFAVLSHRTEPCYHDCKRLAEITVNEVINAFDDCHCGPILDGTFGVSDWHKVKEEIQKL